MHPHYVGRADSVGLVKLLNRIDPTSALLEAFREYRDAYWKAYLECPREPHLLEAEKLRERLEQILIQINGLVKFADEKHFDFGIRECPHCKGFVRVWTDRDGILRFQRR